LRIGKASASPRPFNNEISHANMMRSPRRLVTAGYEEFLGLPPREQARILDTTVDVVRFRIASCGNLLSPAASDRLFGMSQRLIRACRRKGDHAGVNPVSPMVLI